MALAYKFFLESLLSFTNETHIAVGLSGGGDSMALTSLLSKWCAEHTVKLHILHVNHNLRPQSLREAKQIQTWVNTIPHSKFKILDWVHTTNIRKKIQETAREHRYRLMGEYCKTHGIHKLFIAHHADDQAETILFRLAKGSGIDGLVGMQFEQPLNDHVSIIRPLLHNSHADLIEYCDQQPLNYFEDPSNKSEEFARVRLRNARAILESEGLTAERLGQISKRIGRARDALNFYCSEFLKTYSVRNGSVNLAAFKSLPADIMIRVLQSLIEQMQPKVKAHKKTKYAASLERIESIAEMIENKTNGRATIANCLISWSKTSAVLNCRPEHQTVEK